jgi:hypothetical protein
VTNPPQRPSLEIRSYRTVFELERRLYRIDRLRLPPGGIPMRGALYCLGLVLLAVVLSGLPVVATVADIVPWYVRDLAAPIALAALLALLRMEGRPFHLAARTLIGQRLGPRWWRRLQPASGPGARWHPPDLLMLPDGSEGRWRPFDYRGPGAVMVIGDPECRDRRLAGFGAVLGGPHVTVHEPPAAPGPPTRRVVALGTGTRLRVRPAARQRER